LLLTSSAAIIGAWIFASLGYTPCALCLLQRKPHYAVIAITLLTILFSRGNNRLERHVLFVIGLLMLLGAGLGAYHAGVEWKWWPGPASCSGAGFTGVLPDLNNPVVMCDKAAIRIFGLSLAGWNVVISVFLAAIAFRGARRKP
jgi:disulfide bond formation protein DsbB